MNGDFNTYFVRSVDDYIELPFEESDPLDASVLSDGSSESVPVVEDVQTIAENTEEVIAESFVSDDLSVRLDLLHDDLVKLNYSVMLVLFALLFTFVWRVFRK